jgi:hypothetical protein
MLYLVGDGGPEPYMMGLDPLTPEPIHAGGGIPRRH